jgi:hypothetical protein
MAWLAVDKDGTELCFKRKPVRCESKGKWDRHEHDIVKVCKFRKGTIGCFLGKRITWEDEPVEIH